MMSRVSEFYLKNWDNLNKHIIMAETTLRNLSKAYAKKSLPLEAYRQARGKYINGILTGDIVLTINDYPRLIKPADDESLEVTVRRDKKKTP